MRLCPRYIHGFVLKLSFNSPRMHEANAMAGSENKLLVDNRSSTRVVVLWVIRIDGSDQNHPRSRLGIPAVNDAGLVILNVRS